MPRIQEEMEAKLTRLSALLKAVLTKEMLAGCQIRILLQHTGKDAKPDPF